MRSGRIGECVVTMSCGVTCCCPVLEKIGDKGDPARIMPFSGSSNATRMGGVFDANTARSPKMRRVLLIPDVPGSGRHFP